MQAMLSVIHVLCLYLIVDVNPVLR